MTQSKLLKKGYADILIGLQYGDEGKARVVDFLAKNYDVIARFNGGANAGHTIETKEGVKVALNQIPS
ncbi:MAG: adenylosuccinate synthetase, partial [Patescibacteria group bacterium]